MVSQLFRITNDYEMVTRKAPFFPLLLTSFLAYEDDMDTPAAMERRVEKAGGWQPLGMDMASQVAHLIGDEDN